MRRYEMLAEKGSRVLTKLAAHMTIKRTIHLTALSQIQHIPSNISSTYIVTIMRDSLNYEAFVVTLFAQLMNL